MGIKQELETALHEAMRSGDELKKLTVRTLLANIKLAEVEKHSALDEAAVASLLQKEIKSRRESIEDAKKANRTDLIAESEKAIAVIEAFLPKGLSEEELRALVSAAIAEVGAASPADMGKVMKVLVSRVQGRAPGDQVSQMVRQMLQP